MRCISLIVLFFAITPFLAAQDQPAAADQPQFAKSQLEQLVAPIALYPDDLLAQVLAASTYPADIVAASRFIKRNPGLDQDEIKSKITDMEWDPSVKGLMFFPELLVKMNDNMDWTKDLGDAFLNQQKDVMDTIQLMREKAKNAGTLQSNANQDVTTNTTGQTEIQSTDPTTVYPQDYVPSTAYGSGWGYSNCYYPAVIAAPAWPYRGGYACAWALGYRCGWNNGGLEYNNNYYRGDFYRNNISNAVMNPANRGWAHNAATLPANAQQLARRAEATGNNLQGGDRTQAARSALQNTEAAGRTAQNLNRNGLAASNAAGNNLQTGDRTQAARSALQNADRSQAAAQVQNSQRLQNSQNSAQNYSYARQTANPAMSGSRNADLERSYSNRGAQSRTTSAYTNNRGGSYQSHAGSAGGGSRGGGGRGGGGGRR